ncbi:hypothetical protein M3Y94_00750600 [Aphelenchoides besseyi]|nr:hypothetical protein M3Y94_00750600 [Aphelenchoides besseyi]KAI6232071.1 hypothetical protein M3Y95_00448200 [Aphelenchoides besseyi]
MLCQKPFHAESQRDYNREWGVVYNNLWGYKANEYKIKVKSIDRYIEKLWEEHRMTPEGEALRNKVLEHLRKLLKPVYPTGVLMCGGSTTSRCGVVDSDMDLCYVVQTQDVYERSQELPIVMYQESEVNKFMVDRIHMALRKHKEIVDISTTNARVPIVTFKMSSKAVDKHADEVIFDFDVNCNCVAGIYNRQVPKLLARCDERLPKLCIALKKWAKNVKVVGINRFNSYTVTCLIVHFLQCGVQPPILPNLIKLDPRRYDGDCTPWELTTDIDAHLLPKTENTMTVGELFCAFFYYYNDFDFVNYGILIRDASIIKMNAYGRFEGAMGSRVFLEEPYDGLTVPKNVKEQSTFDHIKYEFKYVCNLLGAKGIKNKFSLLMNRVHEPEHLTQHNDPGVAKAEEPQC